MRRSFLLLTTLALVAFAAPVRANNAENWHWQRGLGQKAQIVLIDSLTPNWTKAFRRAVKTWNESSDAFFEITVVKGSDSKATRQACDSPDEQPIRVRVCNGAYPEDSWAGLATVFHVSGHVASARVRFNNLVIGPSRHTACHELGHVLGLAHRAEEDYASCMKQAGDSKVGDAHDLEQLEIIYDHSH